MTCSFLDTSSRFLNFSTKLLDSDFDRQYLTKHLLVLAFVQKSFQGVKSRFFTISCTLSGLFELD